MPAELKRIERLLSSDSRPAPSAGLRQRSLGGVRIELRRQRRRRRVRFAASVAAALLACVGFSISAVEVYCSARTKTAPPSVSKIAEQLRAISPGLSVEESLRKAMMTQSGAEAGGRSDLSDAVHVEMQIVEPKSTTNQ